VAFREPAWNIRGDSRKRHAARSLQAVVNSRKIDKKIGGKKIRHCHLFVTNFFVHLAIRANDVDGVPIHSTEEIVP
jgi:hypothetical protein